MYIREEAETEESKKKSDEMRLKLAIEKSREEQAKVSKGVIIQGLSLLLRRVERNKLRLVKELLYKA